MLRILLIIFLVGYVVYKLSSFFFRIMYASVDRQQQTANKQYQSGQQYARRPADGNVNIDYVPQSNKSADNSNRKVGDYVDYEEVK